jgi:hypothetical protein
VASVSTFSDLKSLLSTLLDDTGTTFYSDEERERAINAAYLELYAEAVDVSGGNGPTISTSTLTVTADTNTITLPTDFLHLVDLYYQQSTNDTPKRWKRINARKQAEYHYIGRGEKQLCFYIMSQTTARVVPTPSWTGSVECFYIAEPTVMTTGTDEPDFPLTSRELIAYEAFHRLKEKEGVNPTGAAEAKRRELRHRFETDMRSLASNEADEIAGPDGYHIYNMGSW